MKNAFKAYVAGLKKSTLFSRPIIIIYLVNLLMALTVALPFMGRLQAAFGQSMLPEAFRTGFDFTAMTEILRQSGEVLGSLLAQAWWVVLLYLLLGIFWAGGILSIHNGQTDKVTFRMILEGGSTYFFRFFKLFVYMGFCHLLAALIVYLPMVMILKGSYETVETEASLFYIVISAIMLHILLLVLLLMVSVYAKVRLVQSDSRKVFRSLLKSFAFAFRRFSATFPLMLLLGISAILAGGLYWLLGSLLNGFGTLTLLILFLVQQAYLLLRVWLRVWYLVSHSDLYAHYFPGQSEQAAYDWV